MPYIENRLWHMAVKALVLAAILPIGGVSAYTATISPANPRAIYLQVGVGGFTGYYRFGGTPGGNATVNLVSVNVPAASLGTGVAQPMTTNSSVAASSRDGWLFCNVPSQLYVAGFYRYNSNASGSAAVLTATAPANLVTALGDTIPFSQISWTSTGYGDIGAQPFPAGTFTGLTQNIGNIERNTWAESCHTFSYANTTIRAAGTYTGRVTYTLSAP